MTTSLSIVVSHVGAAINSSVLTPPPPKASASTTQRGKEQATASSSDVLRRLLGIACGFNDVCIVHADLASQGMHAYGGVSPRAAMLHRGRPPEGFREPDPAVDIVTKANCALAGPPPTRYCAECQMTLNGPQQFEDHSKGKQHRKNHGQAAIQQKEEAKWNNSGEASKLPASAEYAFKHQ